MAEKFKGNSINTKLFFSSVLTIIPFIFMLIKLQIPGFTTEIQLLKNLVSVNFSVILWFSLVFIGLLLLFGQYQTSNHGERIQFTSLVWQPPSIRKTEISEEPAPVNPIFQISNLSVPWSRIIASMLFISSASWQINAYGFAINVELDVGNAFFLGGPTLSIPTGLIPLIAGIGLAIYSIFALVKVDIGSSPEKIVIIEKRGLIQTTTEIPQEKIIHWNQSNLNWGAQVFWIVIFGIQIYYLAIDGVAWITNPHSFGFAYSSAFHYLIQVGINLLALAILLLWQPIHLLIQTQENEFNLRFYSVIGKNKDVMRKLMQIVGEAKTIQLDQKDQEESNQNQNALDQISKIGTKMIIAAILLLVIVILTRVYLFYSSEPFRVVATLLGLFWLFKGIMFWNSSRKLREIQETIDLNLHKPFNFFDIILISSLIILITIQLINLISFSSVIPTFGTILAIHLVISAVVVIFIISIYRNHR